MTTDAATRSELLGLARDAIAAAIRGTAAPVTRDAAILNEQRGVFVTLTRGGRLRGCIGRIQPDVPLATLLPLMAVAAATEDPRFPPLSERELDGLHIEISLLTPPAPLVDPATVEIGRHGLRVYARGRRGVLLPQVATEQGWSVDEFLSQACVKAALPRDAWRNAGTEVHTFESEIIAEKD
jgi:AmmeMemoRadiSam system protein A